MANKSQALSLMTNFKAEMRIPTYFIEAYIAALGFKTFSDQFREEIYGKLTTSRNVQNDDGMTVSN